MVKSFFSYPGGHLGIFFSCTVILKECSYQISCLYHNLNDSAKKWHLSAPLISNGTSLTLFFSLDNNDLSSPEVGAALGRSLGAMSSLRKLQ